ncbi:MAG: 1-acyl-sn-glycerol-3-phosphate acyltransferase, partial [Bacteroidia bacterium]|nr:1-acyl-sn-glycerol-3-phosphate acyltransferase [Bacteroidia bacterium]
DKGKSLVIFPEGGIYTKEPPRMVRFKDGAFRAAIEKQIPLVPVTIPNNWIILPDEAFLLRWGTVHVIFHEPIETKGLTLADMDRLKSDVYQVIDLELKHQLYENRSLVTG